MRATINTFLLVKETIGGLDALFATVSRQNADEAEQEAEEAEEIEDEIEEDFDEEEDEE